MRDYQNLTGLVAIYIGSVVGAGFASGQEVTRFFADFGETWLMGIVVSVVLLVVLGRYILNLAYRHQLTDYRDAVLLLMGKRFAGYADILVGLFLFGGLAVMIAGGGEAMSETISVAKPIASLAFAGLVLLSAAGGSRRLFQINKILVPLLLLVTLMLIGSRWLTDWNYPVMAKLIPIPLGVMRASLLPNWAVAATLYASFNLGIVFTVFTSLGDNIPDLTTASKAAAWSGLVLGMLLTLVCWGIISTPGAADQAIPMAFLAARGPWVWQIFYLFLLLTAMFTSAVADTYVLLRRYSFILFSRKGMAILIVMAAWLLAQGGFVRLVATVYPAYGYLWAGMLILLLVKRCFAGCINHKCE